MTVLDDIRQTLRSLARSKLATAVLLLSLARRHRRERDVVQRHGRAAVQAAAGRDRIVTARVGAHQPVQRSLLRPDVLPRLPLDETGRAGVPVARRLRRFARDGGASRRPVAAGSRSVGVAGVLPGDRHGWRCQPARHWPGAAGGHQRRVVEGAGRAGGSDRPAAPDRGRRTRDCVGRAIALRSACSWGGRPMCGFPCRRRLRR